MTVRRGRDEEGWPRPALQLQPARRLKRPTGRGRMKRFACIEDLRQAAKRRVPRMFYDYVDSGSWTESTYRANAADLQRLGCVNASPSMSRAAARRA